MTVCTPRIQVSYPYKLNAATRNNIANVVAAEIGRTQFEADTIVQSVNANTCEVRTSKSIKIDCFADFCSDINRTLKNQFGPAIEVTFSFWKGGQNISDEAIAELNIPTGMPLVYKLDQNFVPEVKGGEYLDPETAAAGAAAVANQGK
jgi:hypothetical protein